LTDWTDILELVKEGAKKETAFPERRQKDIELWKAWKESGEDPNLFRPLLQQFRGLIRNKADRWARNIDLPPAVVHAEFNNQFLNAARTYDPNKGAALGTWVTQRLLKANRYLTTYQNPARIVETRTGHQKGLYDNAVSTLEDQFGREASTREISEYLGWAPAEVGRMQAESRKALYSSGYSSGFDPAVNMPSRETEVLRLIKPQLDSEELLVYEHLIGDAGKAKLRPGEIAKKFGWNASKVTRIKNSIAEKVKRYM
jgi:DNA-directed RNA polymerase specialized sigma subunit